MKDWLLIIALSLIGTWILHRYVLEVIAVASGSMEPTLAVGNHYVVNKLVYRLHSPRRGDIVELNSPVDPTQGMIKRVIAIAGDRIEIRKKQVYLNGEPLQEPYTVHKRAHEDLAGDNLGPLEVPEDHVFVLGDDRDESEDSSVWKNPQTQQPIYFLSNADIQGRLIQIP